jgi:hypothetical protein
VTGYLSLVTEVRTGGPLVWCASWWAHPEAVARLTALWRAWEALRLEPATGMSNWWTLHFDPHMRVVLDAERGPFASYTRGQHQDGKLDRCLSWNQPKAGEPCPSVGRCVCRRGAAPTAGTRLRCRRCAGPATPSSPVVALPRDILGTVGRVGVVVPLARAVREPPSVPRPRRTRRRPGPGLASLSVPMFLVAGRDRRGQRIGTRV